MKGHLSLKRMHDLADGLLSAAEAGEAEAHLAVCAPCREGYARIGELVAAVRAMPREARAPEGLWAGIEARIQGTVPRTDQPGADVLSFPGARRAPRRLALTVPQLAAAAVLVALFSAGGMWMAISGPGAAAPSGTVAPMASAVGLGPAARAASSGGGGYDEALLELETIVDQGREFLAPETLASLDHSLRTIDDAMAEIRRALAADPANEVLARMLVRQQRSKLRVLTQAATGLQARS